MKTVDDVTKSPFTLHGLGFIQIQLADHRRIHVWHPDLPRRKCFDVSAVHNHRFGFVSEVLVGTQIDIPCEVFRHTSEPTHNEYVHQQGRQAGGGRPWDKQPKGVRVVERPARSIAEGRIYRVPEYAFHRTQPGGNGMVATILTEMSKQSAPSSSLCRIGFEPETDFDRFQLTEAELYKYAVKVMGALWLNHYLSRAGHEN